MEGFRIYQKDNNPSAEAQEALRLVLDKCKPLQSRCEKIDSKTWEKLKNIFTEIDRKSNTEISMQDPAEVSNNDNFDFQTAQVGKVDENDGSDELS